MRRGRPLRNPPAGETGSNDHLNKPINLDVRSANLYYALTLLFDQLKVGTVLNTTNPAGTGGFGGGGF